MVRDVVKELGTLMAEMREIEHLDLEDTYYPPEVEKRYMDCCDTYYDRVDNLLYEIGRQRDKLLRIE